MAKQEVARFDELGVHIVCNGSQSTLTTYDNPLQINDGKWHFVALIWDSASGDVSLILDAVRTGQSTGCLAMETIVKL